MPESKRVALSTGLNYHYLEWNGSDADHTVVLIHGFLDYGAGWLPTARAGLGDAFHVVAPDMRGHGDSDAVGAGGYYHFFDYIADLRSFLAQVGRQRVSIVGHSMGGSIAGYYAGSYPDEIDKLVLMEGMGPPETDTPVPDRVRLWLQSLDKARTRSPRRYPDLAAAAAQLRARDSFLTEEIATELAEAGTHAHEDGSRSFKHDPLHLTLSPVPYVVDIAQQFWRRIHCPVLLVDGAESRMRHGEQERRRREGCLPHALHVEIPGAGHMIQRHAPDRLAAELIDFLGDETAPSRADIPTD